ncbi:MAG: RHS repeat protein [Lysobacter sp.]|nr:RHS repeat protein [Lysobacter sp.]
MQSHSASASTGPVSGARTFRSLAGFARAAWPLLLLMTGVASAQSITAEAEYQKKIQAASTITAAGTGFFGNRTTDSTGKTEFVNVDIDVPGNSALPVQFGRRLSIDWLYLPEQLGGLGNWDIEVPYIQTTVSSNMGWSIANPSSPDRYKRCSFPGLPYVEGLLVNPEEVSQGYRLHVPGMGDESMLVDTTVNVDPTNGASHPWVLKSMGRLGCLPTAKNGYPGEGFYLLTTDGLKYYFDYAVERTALTIRKGPKGIPGYNMARKNLYLLATRIEDRFGNYVDYTYTNGQLTSIAANDGRQITVQYAANSVTASSHGRTWTYSLQNGHLTAVTNPDGSTWQYSPYGFGGIYNEPQSDSLGLSYFDPGNMCLTPSDQGRYAGEFPFVVKHPSGANATFNFDGRRFYRSRVPYHCFIDFFDHEVKVAGGAINFTASVPWTTVYHMSMLGVEWTATLSGYADFDSQGTTEDVVNVSGYARIGIPNYFDVYSLKSLVITGPGLTAATTAYAYGEDAYPYCGMYDHQTGLPTGVTCSQDPCADGSCDGVGRTTTITLPTGTVIKKRYGVIYEKNEGELLSEQIFNNAGIPVQRADYTYVQDEEMGQHPFPDEAGLGFHDRMESRLRPLVSTVLQRDGVTYSNIVDSFDQFARPTSVTRASNLNYGYSRTDVTAYHDNLSKWVLGQVASVTTAGLMPSKTDFDSATALPIRNYAFGNLVQTVTYNADGTVATIKDANNNITAMSDWKRGIPRTVHYPATPDSPGGSTETAVVNDHGWVTSASDENGYATTYGYDSMGRVSSVAYPTDDSVQWNNTVSSFVQVNEAEMGVPAGHWRQMVLQGNYEKLTVFDALLRPLIQYERDITNNDQTYKIIANTYDQEGRQTFSSYPRNPYADGNWSINTGTHTAYDALGRVVKVEQDSELGRLITTTEYLSGGDIKVTNPRGQPTRTRFAAWDEPTTDYPIEILHPEGAFTQIVRDALFRPVQTRRTEVAP